MEPKKSASRAYIAVVLVLAFALIGILGIISYLGEPGNADLAGLGEHEGDTVVVEAVLVGLEHHQYSTTLLLYQDGVVASAYVEGEISGATVNDIVKVKGQVYRSSSSYALQVDGENSVEVTGEAIPPEIAPGELPGYGNEYVRLTGVVVSVSQDPWGGGTAKVLGIPDLDSVGNWSATCEVRFSSCPNELKSTDRLEVCGVVRSGDGGNYLYVYDEKGAEVEHDYWKPRSLPLGVLSDLAENGGGQYTAFPVNVSGYLKYQPAGYPSITITDDPVDGSYSLRVELYDINVSEEPSKGDLVQVLGTLEYDAEGFKYVLNAQNLAVIEPYGIWNMTLEELVKNYYMFENAWISVDGELEVLGGDSYLVKGNASVRVIGDAVYGEYTQGYLRFDRDGLFYFFEAV